MNPKLFTPDGKPIYGYRYPKWMHQIYNKDPSTAKPYRRTRIYIIDDVDCEPEAEPPPLEEDLHAAHYRRVCDLIRSTFTNEVVHCRCIGVRMKRGQNEKRFMRYFEEELRQYNSDDLVIFFFHGKAGGQGKEYTWNLRGPGPNSINAHDFITSVNRSQADCLFLLDCFIPTNFKNKWERKDHMTEIIAAGAEMRDTDGRPLRGDQNFTINLCRVLRKMAEKPFGKVRSSIPHLLGNDGKANSKCVRIWLNEPARRPFRGWNRKIWRFCFQRGSIPLDGGLQFYKCEIQGPGQLDDSFGVPAGGGGGGDGGGGNGGDSGRTDDEDNDNNDNNGDDSNDGGNDDEGNGDDEDDEDDMFGGGRRLARIARPHDNGFGHDSQDDHDDNNENNTHSKKRTLFDSFKSAKRSKQAHFPTPQSDPIKDEDRSDVPIKPEEQDHEPRLERSRSRSRSTSPEVEYLGYKRMFKTGYSMENAIDLTDGFVDLTADDGPSAAGYDFPIDPALLEESLFMPQD